LSGIQACHYGIPLGSPCPALLTLPVEGERKLTPPVEGKRNLRKGYCK